MCGFIGIIEDSTRLIEELDHLGNLIHHRGPDDAGIYTDNHVQFIFRRLSIIDIDSGHQPLSFDNGRYCIVFNGEIYNYLELRAELLQQGVQFQTESDTETILALYSLEGVDAVKKLRGMFAFIIWDKQKQEIFAARDQFGIKPFFYTQIDGSLYCASESKALMELISNRKVNEKSLQHYLTFQFSPEPETMVSGINKLEPGTFMIKRLNKPFEIHTYWKPYFKPSNLSLAEKKKKILDVMRDSIKVHMRSDVPVGSFLSGGIDSTCIVALAKELKPDIKTFTVGFQQDGFSELDVAKETASILNVENIHYIISPEEYIQELPKIIWHMDEPVADPASVPLYFVAREASKHVTVVLSGEGADELFGGYNIYREPQSLRGFSYLPHSGKALIKQLVRYIPEGLKGRSFLERGCTPIEERYLGNAKIMTEFEKSLLMKNYDPANKFTNITAQLFREVEHYHDIDKMQYIDMHTWLRGDILVKADKMTMAHSLELRVPFLDKEVYKVAAELQVADKITKQTTKLALREAMKEIVPEHVLYRRKLGFPVPIRHWLKGPLYDWALKLIKESDTDHLFDKKYLINLLNIHCQGKLDLSRKIWTVLIFMIWHQIYIECVIDPSNTKQGKIKVPVANS